MITGDIKSKIDAVWNTFWTGGISNPLEVIEPHGPDGLFTSAQVDELLGVLERVERTAIAG